MRLRSSLWPKASLLNQEASEPACSVNLSPSAENCSGMWSSRILSVLMVMASSHFALGVFRWCDAGRRPFRETLIPQLDVENLAVFR
ncbi:hypothetical protein D3C71_993210 [compost metagenome]